MITPFELEEALRAMGVAEVFVGDPTVVAGMVSLGATEGEIGVEIVEGTNNLTAPELTGGIPHQAHTTLESAIVTVPLILGDPDLWARISATGTKGGGYSAPQPVQETTVLVIPRSELGAGLSYGGGPPKVWAPAAPENAVWLWRAFPLRGRVPFRYAEGGKVITEVRFQGMFDASKPEGQKVYTIGDPSLVGITNVVL
jgi:hypothetical protein